MTRRSAIALVTASVISAGAVSASGQGPGEKIAVVAVSGCLTQRGPAQWVLTSATDPTPSIANAPPTGAASTGPATGKNEFALIGITEFDLPSHKDHTVLVKALFIKAAPMSRLNVTSVTHIAPTCPPPPK